MLFFQILVMYVGKWKKYFADATNRQICPLRVTEWIEYHYHLGVSKIYMYDNLSREPLVHKIMPYIQSGLIEYAYVNDTVNADGITDTQLYYYEKCLLHYGTYHDWIAFIDVDEFIIVKNQSKSIPDILQSYESYGGIGLNWMMMGSSGYINRPLNGGVLGSYTKCVPNAHVKSIVRPRYTTGRGMTVHVFTHTDGYAVVDTREVPLTASFNIIRYKGW